MLLCAACAPLCALCLCVIYQNDRIPHVICMISPIIATTNCINHNQGTASTRSLKLLDKSRSIITKKILIAILKRIRCGATTRSVKQTRQKMGLGQNLKKGG